MRLGIAFVLLAWLPGIALAWGADGHRVTGEIAWQLLAPETRGAIRALLPPGRYETLAESATWADTFARSRRDFAWLEPLHYVNIDPRARSVRAGRDCGCVVGAIEIQRDRLADTTLPRSERVLALRLVAHFVGDVHQPLHVSHRDGRGGTTVDLRFEGKPVTLHALWDTALIRRVIRQRGRVRGSRWRAWAQSLADRTPEPMRADWAAERAPRAWASESLEISRGPLFARPEGARLGEAYLREAEPILSRRLQQAGVRLAALLDAALAPGTAPGAR